MFFFCAYVFIDGLTVQTEQKSAIPNFISHNWHLQPLSRSLQASCEWAGIWIVTCDI